MFINGRVAQRNAATASRLMTTDLLFFDYCRLVVHECSYAPFITIMAGPSTIGGKTVFYSEIG
jgi:hypothetical protein